MQNSKSGPQGQCFTPPHLLKIFTYNPSIYQKRGFNVLGILIVFFYLINIYSSSGQICVIPSPQNMIYQGSFENCPVPPGVTQDEAFNSNCAAPWDDLIGTPSICNHIFPYQDPNIFLDAYDGVRFACIDAYINDEGVCERNEGFFQTLNLCAGAKYKLSFHAFWMYPLSTGILHVGLVPGNSSYPCFYGPAYSIIDIPLSPFNTNFQWKLFEQEFLAPQNTSFNKLAFWLESSTGQVSAAGIDAVSLVCLESAIDPNFTWTQDCNGLFNFSSTNNITSLGTEVIDWCWDFGDGTFGSGSGQNPSHTYTNEGEYETCLVIVDNCNCYDKVCRKVKYEKPLSITKTYTEDPITHLLTFQIGVANNQNVAANNVLVTDILDDALNLVNANGFIVNSNTLTQQVTLPALGSTTLTFTAERKNNCSCAPIQNCASAELSGSNCTPAGSCTTISGIGAPNAEITSFTNDPDNCFKINFVSATNNSCDTHTWNFGDGTTGTGANPSHVYTDNGTFIVIHTVTNSCGTVSTTISVFIDCTSNCNCPDANNLNIVADETNGTLWSVYAAAHNLPDQLDYTVHHGCMSIKGKLIIDRNVKIYDCQPLIMNSCAEIIVGNVNTTNYPTLGLSNNKLVGCDKLWNTIKVNQMCGLVASENFFEDAETAITIIPSNSGQLNPPNVTNVEIQDNYFYRNHIGVLIDNVYNYPYAALSYMPFINNIFDGIEPFHFNSAKTSLLSPCNAGSPPAGYNQSQGFAGLITKGAYFQVGTPGSSGYLNIFKDLSNGVMGLNTNISVYRADFEQISGYTWVIPSSNIFQAKGNGVWASNSALTVKNSLFNQVGVGIHSNSYLCTATDNLMPDVQAGISTNNGWGEYIYKNNIHARHYGVFVYNPNIISGTYFPFYHSIIQNDLSTIGTSNDGGLESMVAVISSTNIDAKRLVKIHDNDMYLAKQSKGIILSNINNCNIDLNNIILQNQLDGSPQNCTGIELNNASGNWLYGNSVADQSSITGKTSTAYDVYISGMNTFCCNNSDNTASGIRFNGNCGQTKLRNHNMDNHETTLWCDGPISDQPNQLLFPTDNHSNIFNLGSGLATHIGLQTDLMDSQFPVKTDLQTDWPEVVNPSNPNHYDPTAWFFITGNNTKNCSGSSDCTEPTLGRGGEIDDTDRHAANGSYQSSGLNGATSSWEGRLRLYARMRNFPEMRENDQTLRTFYDGEASNGTIKSFYEAENAIALANEISNAHQTIIASAYAGMMNQDSMAQITLTRLSTAVTGSDSLAIFNQVNAYRRSAASYFADVKYIMNQVDSIRNMRSTQALALVNALPETDVLQTNRKKVNKIYLETVGQGLHSLSTSQFSEISTIAHQCPKIGGTAVYMARSLYLLNAVKQFKDDSLCQIGKDRSIFLEENKISNPITIRPNPANDWITVTIPSDLLTDGFPMLEITDLSGRIIYSRKITLVGDHSIPTAPWASGMYLCRITGIGKAVQPLKFTIQH